MQAAEDPQPNPKIDLIFQISQVSFQDTEGVLFRILRLCQIAFSLSIL